MKVGCEIAPSTHWALYLYYICMVKEHYISMLPNYNLMKQFSSITIDITKIRTVVLQLPWLCIRKYYIKGDHSLHAQFGYSASLHCMVWFTVHVCTAWFAAQHNFALHGLVHSACQQMHGSWEGLGQWTHGVAVPVDVTFFDSISRFHFIDIIQYFRKSEKW